MNASRNILVLATFGLGVVLSLASVAPPANEDAGIEDDGGGTLDAGAGDAASMDAAGTDAAGTDAAGHDTGSSTCEGEGLTGESEPNETFHQATRISSAQAVSGAISADADEDWYVIEVCGERILELALTNAPDFQSDVTYEFELFESDGVTSMGAEYQSGASATVNFDRNYYIPAAGLYYVRIADRYGSGNDPDGYTLTVTSLTVPDADAEPNGNSTNPGHLQLVATAVSSGVQTTGYIASLDDDDWYAITVTGESILQVDLTNAPAVSTPLTLEFEAYDTDADTGLGGEYQSGASSIIVLTRNYYLPAAGTYYVRVADRYSSAYDYAQPYLLTLTELAVPDAAAEPNGNSSNADYLKTIATVVSSGVQTTGYIASLVDDDWFAIAIGGESILQVELTNAPAVSTPLTLEFEAYATDAATAMGAEYESGASGSITLSRRYYIAAAGTYYVRVADRYSSAYDYTQPYLLTLTERVVPDAAFEPNGNSDNLDYIKTIATVISSATPVQASIASIGDEDWYKVTPAGAGTLAISLSNAPAVVSAVTYELEIFEADASTSLGAWYDSGSQGTVLLNGTANVQAGADYYFRVSDRYSSGDDYDQPYTLTLTIP
ncbi:MAG: hypothetical protein ABIJ09_24450 [Pseudomonadota bacterium]